MARIQYTVPQVVVPPKSADSVECRGVHYRFTQGQPSTVTFYFEAMNSLGVTVSQDAVTLTLTPQEADKAQRDAFKEVARAFPDGPVV